MEAYRRARFEDELETGLPVCTFPEACPWSFDPLPDDTFRPA